MARTPGARHHTPRDVNAAQRASQVVQLRIGGMSVREIAERVGLSQGRISQIIKKALETQRKTDSDELRALELARAEGLHRAMWPKALHGDTGAAGVVLRASERRSRLLALDLGGDGSGAGGAASWVVQVYLRVDVGSGSTRDVVDSATRAALDEARDAAIDATPTMRTPPQLRARVYEHRSATPPAVPAVRGPYILPDGTHGDALAYHR